MLRRAGVLGAHGLKERHGSEVVRSCTPYGLAVWTPAPGIRHRSGKHSLAKAATPQRLSNRHRWEEPAALPGVLMSRHGVQVAFVFAEEKEQAGISFARLKPRPRAVANPILDLVAEGFAARTYELSEQRLAPRPVWRSLLDVKCQLSQPLARSAVDTRPLLDPLKPRFGRLGQWNVTAGIEGRVERADVRLLGTATRLGAIRLASRVTHRRVLTLGQHFANDASRSERERVFPVAVLEIGHGLMGAPLAGNTRVTPVR